MKKGKLMILHPKSIILYLLLSFLLLYIPVECTGFLFLSWSKDKVQEEIDNSARSSIHYLMDNFIVEINDFTSQLTRFSNNNLFTQFALSQGTMSPSEYYGSLLDQKNLLKYSPGIHAMIEDIVVYYPEAGGSLSATGSWESNQKDAIFDRLSAIQSSNTIIKEYEGSLFLSSQYPLSSQYHASDPMYFLTLELSQDAITSFLDLYGQEHDTILYLHHQKKAICSSSIQDPKLYTFYIDQLENLRSTDPAERIYSLSDSNYYVLAEYSSYLDCSVLQFIPMEEVYKVPNQIQHNLLIYSLLSIPVICIFCILIYRLIARPIQSLLQGYQCVQEECYTTQLSEDVTTYEFKTLIRGFNNMTAHLHYTIDQLYQNKLYTQKIELKQLQMQMNPHFLYNTYFILHRLIKNENLEQAEELSSYLGNYFKYITRNARDIVPLREEWEHAESYLKIQEIRFSPRIRFICESLPAECADFLVPRIIIQPLLENALVHGLKDVQEDGEIRLRLIQHTDSLEILIGDNGNCMTEDAIFSLNESIHANLSPDKEYTALHNIHKRLQLVYGEKSGLTLTPNRPSGILVHIIIKTDNHENEVGETL